MEKGEEKKKREKVKEVRKRNRGGRKEEGYKVETNEKKRQENGGRAREIEVVIEKVKEEKEEV